MIIYVRRMISEVSECNILQNNSKLFHETLSKKCWTSLACTRERGQRDNIHKRRNIASKSLFFRSHISAFPGIISASMTEKVLESGVNAY